MKKTNRTVFLWGMMGAGKSTAGKYLLDTFDLIVDDLDEFIEVKEGKSIAELFNIYGESHFREIESNALHDLIYNHSQDVIVTGGGTPCFHQNNELMVHNGLTIYIDSPVQVILQQIMNDTAPRPVLDLLDNLSLEEQLRVLLLSRSIFYQKAHFTLKVNSSKAWIPTLAGLIL